MLTHTALTNYIRFISLKSLFYEFLNEEKREKFQKLLIFCPLFISRVCVCFLELSGQRQITSEQDPPRSDAKTAKRKRSAHGEAGERGKTIISDWCNC
jgi:hypothetical protein